MFNDPTFIAIILGGVLLCASVVVPIRNVMTAKADRKRRLGAELDGKPKDEVVTKGRSVNSFMPSVLTKKAIQFSATSNPESIQVLRKRLVQAGFVSQEAMAFFFIYRFLLAAGLGLGIFIAMTVFGYGTGFQDKAMFVGAGAVLGYLLPSMYLDRLIKTAIVKNREGFPDFMDLMIVCADAGMSMEASIERVARELEQTRPVLSMHISIMSLEIRAGRPLAETLKSLGDRLGLDEVRSFSTLLQQSKELGTSLGDALKIFSDDMRNKRVMAAEEKAHALPAKMSVPVILFMLPVVIFVAIWPVVVRFSTQSI